MSQSLDSIISYNTNIRCIVTDIGLKKSQEAANKDGWYINPIVFSVSEVQGLLNSSRDKVNIEWYKGRISSRRIIDEHTIEFTCDIPPNASNKVKKIGEVYLLCEDEENEQFLLCIGQTDVSFNPNVSISLSISLNLLNINAVSTFKIVNSSVADIKNHNLDTSAHPDIRKLFAANSGELIITSNPIINANVGDIIYANTKDNPITINLPKDTYNGNKITVIDIAQTSNKNNIIVHPATNQAIDLCLVDFILNSPGSWVTFIWYQTLKSWAIDIGGRNLASMNTDARDIPLRYTDYFSGSGSGLSKYSDTCDYQIGDVVIGNDYNLYRAVISNGPSHKIIQNPILTDSNSWSPLLVKRVVHEITQPITKNTPVTVTPYTIGENQISVFIQGIRCECGTYSAQHTYYLDNTKQTGRRANKIYFYDDIPANFEVTIIRE